MRKISLATLAVALLTLTGCQVGCTAMYAPDQLGIVLDGTYSDGDYELEVEGDGADVLCTFVVGDGTAETTVCDSSTEELYFQTGTEGEVLSLSLSEQTPSQVTVRLFRDGTELASEGFNPEYAEDQPNGKGCGDRNSAEVVFAW